MWSFPSEKPAKKGLHKRALLVFCPDENEKPAFTISSCLKSVLEKRRFRDGLMRTVGLIIEIKMISAQYSSNNGKN